MDQGNAEKVSDVTEGIAGEQASPPEATAGATAGEPTASAPSERVAELENELAAKDAQLKRMGADFDNARKRQSTEREELTKFAAERVMLNLLPVIDNFDRALQAAHTATDVATVTQGIDMIYRQLQELLTKTGVAPIEAAGRPFDPALHEAVQRVPAETDQQDNTIVEELQRGYLLNGKVIRHALVKVAVSG
ncbi:MAG: nucleotide exchange factor GrpE [Candidatus Sericytochromatia bacterium]|nr:nucleotide exchange factor GrpE [Candidatus Sericytochromatia bacterium]